MDTTAVAAAFDEAVLDCVPWALAAEGVEQEALNERPTYVKSILLHDARRMDSFPGLTEHLDRVGQTKQRVGFDTIPDQSTLYRSAVRLSEAGYRDRITAAAKRAAFAAARNGVPTPDPVRTAHELEMPTVVDERAISSHTERAAILNWMDYLLDDLLAPISFGRASNSSFTIKQIIGAFAQAALVNSLNSARPTALWYYSEDEIPTASQVSGLVRQLTHRDILEMFTEVTQVFLEKLRRWNFLQRPVGVAIDKTWFSWGGKGEPSRGEHGLIGETDQVDTGRGWCFATLCVTNSDARFALGQDLLSFKNEGAKKMRRFLQLFDEIGEIERIYADREFESADVVRICRDVVRSNWVVRVRNLSRNAVKDIRNDTSVGESAFRESIEFADLNMKPNFYLCPTPEDHRKAGGVSHFAFLTDLSRGELDQLDLYHRYQTRWSVETFYRQLKHRFGASTESPSPELRLFIFNIGTLFYNIHTLLNRARSPEFGIRLDVPYYQVLQGLIESIYTRRSNPTGVEA
jgi:hypothetical protein